MLEEFWKVVFNLFLFGSLVFTFFVPSGGLFVMHENYGDQGLDIGGSEMSFESAKEFVLSEQIEGGYVNHPEDRGGETNMGITGVTYHDALRKGLISLPHPGLAYLTKSEAEKIYKYLFWDAPNLRLEQVNRINESVATVLFDLAVNSGTVNAAKELQALVGVTKDGIIGPKTLAAIEVRSADSNLAEDFIWQRLDRYYRIIQADKSQWAFMRGWRNRLNLLADEIGVGRFPI